MPVISVSSSPPNKVVGLIQLRVACVSPFSAGVIVSSLTAAGVSEADAENGM